MTHNHRIENSAEHQDVSALLPWYVNETLGERDRERVDAHVGVCASCREDLAVQQRICAAIEARPALDYMPAASLKRLQARLDAAGRFGRGAGAAAAANCAPLAMARLDGRFHCGHGGGGRPVGGRSLGAN